MREETLKDLFIMSFIAGSVLLAGGSLGLIAFRFGKKTMMRVVLSVASGLSFIFLTIFGYSLLGNFYDPLRNEIWAHHFLLWLLAWPLLIFKHIFPPPSGAMLATLITDIVIYSLPAYVYLLRRGKEVKPLEARAAPLKIA
ncbi:MAG TPA: hypothetical protein VGO96_21530 [Pyrinomonadaceae bacterium]|nr:hypothetical protein [Pyrinomonadaceae bacterium]